MRSQILLVVGVLIATVNALSAVAQTTIVQSNIGSGCSSVCINGNCKTSCDGQDADLRVGSGQIQNKAYHYSEFDSVVIEGVDATVNQSELYSVSVTADSNLLDYVEVGQIGSTLHISLAPGQYESTAFRLEITAPVVKFLSSMGAADLHFNGFEQVKMELKLQGAGESRGEGNLIENLVLRSDGTGLLDFSKSRVNSAELFASGAVDIRLAFEEKQGQLVGELQGASELSYCGSPENNLKVSGVADVRRVECDW